MYKSIYRSEVTPTLKGIHGLHVYTCKYIRKVAIYQGYMFNFYNFVIIIFLYINNNLLQYIYYVVFSSVYIYIYLYKIYIYNILYIYIKVFLKEKYTSSAICLI